MKVLSVLLIFTALTSCQADEPLQLHDLKSKVIIEVLEDLKTSPRTIALYCRTEEIYSCSNFALQTKNTRINHIVKIDFLGIDVKMICPLSLGPSTAIVDLGVLDTGEYKIGLNNGSIASGKLKVSANEITLIVPQSNGIKIERVHTKRIPVNTFWGVIGYYEEHSSMQVDEFVQELILTGAQFGKQDPGNYAYYEIDAAGNLAFDSNTFGYRFARPLIFQYYGDKAKLKELIQSDGKKYKDIMSIAINTFEGETFYN